jgi:hypothetical protein
MGARLCSLFLITALIGWMSGPSLRSALAEPAQAICKPELTGEGRRSDPGSAEEKVSDALKFSISKWGHLAEGLYGSQFANWESARERKIECEFYEQPWLNGRVSCVAIALPCDRR